MVGVTAAATEAPLTSGNWKTSLALEGVAELPMLGPPVLPVPALWEPLLLWLEDPVPQPTPALCFRGPISVKEKSSGEDGWDWEEGDWVWYPLEGLPGLGLALPVDPA